MDILNFISWIASRRRVVTSAPDDALVPIGIRTETRDDKYTTVAIKKSDLITAPEPAYKVYTALLSQSGGSIINYLYSGSLVKGVSYTVTSATSNCDFTNVGGPSGVSGAGLSFVATENLEPNNWDGSELEYNEGAPVAIVLENTIGNVWFNYFGIGQYQIFSDNLFTLDKSWATAYSGGDDEVSFNGFVVSPNGNNELRLNSGNGNNDHISIRLEIRVYN
jgi:hypothetical protein